MQQPVHVVIYGSSLFSTAVAASLRQLTTVSLIYLTPPTNADTIIGFAPAIFLYMAETTLPDPHRLLAASIQPIEINTHQSLITHCCHPLWRHQYPITQAGDIFALLARQHHEDASNK